MNGTVRCIGQAPPRASELRSRPVDSFDVQELNMIDALLQLGQEQQVPIGIESSDAAALRSRITLRIRNSTMGGRLDNLTHGEGYRGFSEDGVAMVTTTVSHRVARTCSTAAADRLRNFSLEMNEAGTEKICS